MTLPPQPLAPPDVQCALTVPRTVLYADLGLRGNARSRFAEVLGIDYEPAYVAFDGPDISWNFTSDEAFASALLGDQPLRLGVARFVSAMSTTSRLLDKVSAVVGAGSTRRAGDATDLMDDLRTYWDARELHATNLFMFWNVDHMLAEALTELASDAGLTREVEFGLPSFLQPNESNYFAFERNHVARIARRFLEPGKPVPTVDEISPAFRQALEFHIDHFGFVLAPFVGAPPSLESLLAQVAEAAGEEAEEAEEPEFRVSGPPLADFSLELQELGELGQQIAFWKTERIDVMALGDARATPMYREVAGVLDLPPDHVLAMTRNEIETSLRERALVLSGPDLADRLARYCLILHNGEIAFYEPTAPSEATEATGPAHLGDELRGTVTSPGVATGTVVVIPDPATAIRDRSYAERVSQGSILVTTMTRPELGAALERAAAWVTEEGGRTSHAAILSRELDKPCVTAVLDATTRLVDGMVVTVDGDRGIVVVDHVS